MYKNRIEAFSDGVIAIIVTVMILELRVPEIPEWNSIFELKHKFISYIISFCYVIIYWHNHHHIFQAIEKINGRILWANSNFLFFLSLIPSVTAWAGENNFVKIPVILYGIVLLLCGFAYFILIKEIIKFHGENSFIKKALGNLKKEIISILLYSLALAIAFIFPMISMGIYALVAIIWAVPEKRIELNYKK